MKAKAGRAYTWVYIQSPGIVCFFVMVNAVGKKCSEVERAYIAGLFDADGAIMALIERHKEKRHGFRVRVHIKLTQHDREILDWVQIKLHSGIVRANRFGTERQTFDLHIRDKKQAENVLMLLKSYIRVKHRQARIALDILRYRVTTEKDLLHVARLADTLSRFNVRSKNRRKNFASKIQKHLSCND